MRPLRFLHSRLIRGLHKLQRHPPAPRPLSPRHLADAVLVVDRLELLKRLPAGGRVMECGVDEGLFSEQILEIVAPERLMLVDTWGTSRFGEEKHQLVQRKFADRLASGQVTIERTTSLDALRSLADGSLNWLYIDTDHSYATTRVELELAAIKVASDGLICGHDYTIGSWESFHRYGVVEAVNDFCATHDWGFAYLTHEPRRHLSFALRRLA